jgi:ferric-dicitrate binding protein FerR (iron transport regulator)
MEHAENRLHTLIDRYLAGETSPAENRELEILYAKAAVKKQALEISDQDAAEMNQVGKESWMELIGQMRRSKPKQIKLWPRIAGVAAAVAAIAFGIWFYTSRQPGTAPHPELVSASQDIAPGGNHATLTSNGKTINLSDAKTGLAVNAAQLTYNDGTTIDPSALGMTDGESRTLEVTALRGGIYSIILQDGTKAWLNAASKLKFLSNYRNKLQRIVKLEGQAYFEVAKDAKRPFIVESQGQRVEVLGTHFDISAYPGEAIKTTLLEGSVRVASLAPSGRGAVGLEGQVVLKPNQQSTIHLSPSGRGGEAREANITVKQVDPTDAIAWKNGDFVFKGESLESAMQQIARWYNVDVLYDNNLPQDVVFWGYVSRSRNLSVVLKQMQNTKQVKFKLEGRTIRVTK